MYYSTLVGLVVRSIVSTSSLAVFDDCEGFCFVFASLREVGFISETVFLLGLFLWVSLFVYHLWYLYLHCFWYFCCLFHLDFYMIYFGLYSVELVDCL